MENPLHQAIGPGYVPALVSACLAIVGLTQTASSLRRRPAAQEAMTSRGPAKLQEASRPRWVLAAILIGGALWLWTVGGYVAGILSAVFVMMLIDRKVQPWRAFWFSALVTASLWVLFDAILKVHLS
jgi:hypothetical protein